MTDEQDLEAFCRGAYPRLVGALGHYTGDRWLAEELAQEALVRVCDHWGRVRHLRAPMGWAFRVGANLAHSHFRRARVERKAHDRLRAKSEVHLDPDTPDRMAVREALGRLTDKQRQVVILRYYLGLPAVETADHLGLRPGAVRSLTSRALAVLRDELDVEVEDEAWQSSEASHDT